MSSSSSSSSSPAVSKGSLHSQPFDYYIVLDFEASCEDNNRSFLNVRSTLIVMQYELSHLHFGSLCPQSIVWCSLPALFAEIGT